MIDWLVAGLLLAIWITLMLAAARLRGLLVLIRVASDMNHEQQIAMVRELESIQADVAQLRRNFCPSSLERP